MSKITKETEQQVIGLYQQGEINKSKIALKFGISRGSVINLLKRNNIEIRKERIHSHEEISLYFEKYNCKLLSKFTNVCKQVDYICRCGRKSRSNFNAFRNGSRCRECMKEKFKTPKEEVFKFIEQRGHTVLSTEYINSHTKLDLVCPKGHKIRMTYSSIKCGRVCQICGHQNQRGEKHPKWNPNRSYEERAKQRKTPENKEWRSSILRRDCYTCQKCNCKGSRKTGGLLAHHLNGFHWDEQNRLNLANGITLCGNCHSEFHKFYGRKDNTIVQYNEWNLSNKILNNSLIEKSVLYKNTPSSLSFSISCI